MLDEHENLQRPKSEDTANGSFLLYRHLQRPNHPKGQRENDGVDDHFDDAAAKPKDVVVEAVIWVDEIVDPAVVNRIAIRESSDGAADPVSDAKRSNHVQLASENIVDGKNALVHEDNGELRRSGDGEVQDGHDIADFQIDEVFWRVLKVGICSFGYCFVVWINLVAYREKRQYRSKASTA